VEVPHVEREEYDVLEVSDKGELSLVGKNGEMVQGVTLPKGDLSEIIQGKVVMGDDVRIVVLKAMEGATMVKIVS